MRFNPFLFLVALLAMGAIFMVPATTMAQEIFLKKDHGSGSSSNSDGGGTKLYLTPKPGDLGKTRFTSSQQRTIYNTAGRNQPRRTAPSTQVNRSSDLDRIQQANIEGAQARAAENAEKVRQMQKVWDAERAAAAEQSLQRKMAEKAAKEQSSAAASGEGSGRDLTNARYLQETGKGMKAPARTFNIFR